MASSNIKLFDENKGNMLSDSEFNSSTQRMNGLQAGVASSKLQNKAMYQASLVAYAIAHVMMQNGKNANDTDAVSAFVSNLSGTMLQKVYDIATTAEAQAGVATGKWMSPALVKTAMNYMLANPVTFGSTVTLARDPTGNLQAATKQYVDNNFIRNNWVIIGTGSGSFKAGADKVVSLSNIPKGTNLIRVAGSFTGHFSNDKDNKCIYCKLGDLILGARYYPFDFNNVKVDCTFPVWINEMYGQSGKQGDYINYYGGGSSGTFFPVSDGLAFSVKNYTEVTSCNIQVLAKKL